MTPEELREWSAGLMGYSVHHGERKAPGISPPLMVPYVQYWGPEGQVYWDPLADLNQAFMVAKKMRELGWSMQFWMLKEDYRVVFYKKFVDWRELRERDYTKASTIALAILLAAHATGEGQENKEK